jgi:molecular chaperone HscB
MNYFEVFSLPKLLNIDLGGLEKKFHDLSRKYHPDYFSTGTPEERRQAVRMTALLNDAYRTLRHPVRRVEYLLALEGFKPDGSKVPQPFLIEVFEINEQMQEAKAGRLPAPEVAALRAEIQRRAAEFDAELKAAQQEWDRLVNAEAPATELKNQLTRLTEILSESSYIRNLEHDLEVTL